MVTRPTPFRLVLEYDGTEFAGWQVQPRKRTVQGELAAALERVTGGRARVDGAGRTDAGVHAAGMVARALARWRHGPDRLRDALNAGLPADLAVREAAACPASFDPRRLAVSRTYRYTILTGTARSPLARRCAWWVKGPLSISRMTAAARAFTGLHDFSSFTTAAGRARGAVRTIPSIALRRRGGMILIDVTGRSFLHHLIRTIAGELVAAGQGRSSPAEIRAALTRSGFRAFRWLAPPQGLCLLRVRYPGDRPAPLPPWPPGIA